MAQEKCKLTGLMPYECAHCLQKKRGGRGLGVSTLPSADVDALWEIRADGDPEDPKEYRVRKEDEEYPDPAEAPFRSHPRRRAR